MIFLKGLSTSDVYMLDLIFVKGLDELAYYYARRMDGAFPVPIEN